MLQQFNEKNRDLLININGKLVHRDEAGISPFDSAVQGGDAVWEGLRLYKGRIFRLMEHLDRLKGSAQALAFAKIPSHDQIIDEIKRTLAANLPHADIDLRKPIVASKLLRELLCVRTGGARVRRSAPPIQPHAETEES